MAQKWFIQVQNQWWKTTVAQGNIKNINNEFDFEINIECENMCIRTSNVKIRWFDVAGKKTFNLQCYFFIISKINMWLLYDKKTISANLAIEIRKHWLLWRS